MIISLAMFGKCLMVAPSAVISIIGIICQSLNVLCEAESFNFSFAEVYLEIFDFISIRFVPVDFISVGSQYETISVALYGLFLFYGLTKEELAGRRPLAKFLSIKLIVMFTWYQSFIVRAMLAHWLVLA